MWDQLAEGHSEKKIYMISNRIATQFDLDKMFNIMHGKPGLIKLVSAVVY